MLLEKPRNYEEAKVIIKNSANDDLEKHNRKKNLIRSGIIAGLSYGAAAAVGIITHNTSNFVAALPLASMVTLTSFFPMIYNRSIRKKIESGKIFEGRTEQDIVDAASSYVDQYNQFERTHKSR